VSAVVVLHPNSPFSARVRPDLYRQKQKIFWVFGGSGFNISSMNEYITNAGPNSVLKPKSFPTRRRPKPPRSFFEEVEHNNHERNRKHKYVDLDLNQHNQILV
jgi:hypothetical protein